jgi:bifunctional DNA-binding transcriptional regulator/antitoxin component of YhaV-PrlF toxin-antitoxin module
MGYRIRVQKVDRPSNRSFYVNFPAPIADAVNLRKGEELDWIVEDRNTFIIKRAKPVRSFLKKK